MKKILIYLLICITGAICAACVRSSSTLNGADKITESVSELATADIEASKEQGTETEAPSETEAPKETETEVPQETAVKYELSTVESLEDDGREMSAAEALRSAMKGKHSALELVDSFDEKYAEDRVFSNYDFQPEPFNDSDIKDYPNDGLARVNVLNWNSLGVSATEENWEWKSFVCADLEHDGSRAIFLEAKKVFFTMYAILYYYEGEVYISYLDMPNGITVYKSGVIGEISGARYADDEHSDEEYNSFYFKFYPAKGALYRELVAGTWYSSGQIHYAIDNKSITEEDYDVRIKDYLKELTGGESLKWHDFTEENIDKYVVD